MQLSPFAQTRASHLHDSLSPHATMTYMRHKPRTQAKLRSFGQILGAVPDIRELRDEVAAVLASGGSDEECRALAVQRGAALGIAGPKALIPSLTRKIMRHSFRDFLHQVADHLADTYEHKKVSDVADDLWGRVGFDEWFADYVLAWAKNPDGEPGPFFEQMSGRVWTQPINSKESDLENVWVLITPFSDPKALLEEARLECHRVFPDGTWSQYGANEEAHRLMRLKAQKPNRSWGDVAEILVDENEPHLREMGAALFLERKEQERERIEKLMSRFTENYADSFFDTLSAESD